MGKYFLISTIAALISLNANGQAHVHGEGQLLVAQENDKWRFEFMLPAADVLGFEHKPETVEQKAKVASFISSVEGYEHVLSLPKSCSLVETEHSLSDIYEHDKHGEHHDGNENENSHSDVNFAYILKCENSIESVSITLFDLALSLSALEAQWITQSAQGMKEIDADDPTLVF
ncbi:ZrgA family zinc uptake protein [Glaciecola sp. 2405UD65-10]|uniref:ZrgA family zinc uptake protein n=1 Tax=Glaciecola sp. 2405UD65-10 TaxID=3397244 RepID=UPI003B5A6A2B